MLFCDVFVMFVVCAALWRNKR